MNFKLINKIIVCLLIQAALVFAQSTEQIAQLEQKLTSAQMQQDSLTISINKMMTQTDSLSELVSTLRQKQSLNLAERGQLDNLLKKSQSLSAQQENAVMEHKLISQKINEIKTKLTEQYNLRETQLLQSLQNSPKQKQLLENELAEIRKRKNDLANRKPTAVSTTKFDLQIEPNDMPADIEAKAILLRDRENTFRQKAHELEKRYKAVKDETTLRMRMAEMVDDVRLFDSRDEAITTNYSTTAATEEAKRLDYDANEGWFNPEDMGGITNSLGVSEANELLSFDFQTIPDFDMQDYLNDLDDHKKILLREADSLSQIADDFETQADKLRNSLKKSPK